MLAWSTPELPGAGQRASWNGLPGSSAAIAISRAAHRDGLTVVIAARPSEARDLADEIRFYAEPDLPVLTLPDWETLPFDLFSPDERVISERLATLLAIPTLKRGVLVVPLRTALQRLVPRGFVEGQSFDLNVGERFDIDRQRKALDNAGYQNVDTVTERGEYAVRGSLMDVFPMGSDLPVRIDLFDDEIESLRLFDPDTQRTSESVQTLKLLPAREFPFSDEAILGFRDRWHHRFNVDVRKCSIYQDVSNHITPSGIEYYLPLFFDQLGTLFDYLADNTLVIEGADFERAAEDFEADLTARHEAMGHDLERPICMPRELYLDREELGRELNRLARIRLEGDDRHATAFGATVLPDISADPRHSEPAGKLKRYLDETDQPCLFIAETAGRREVLVDFLLRANINPSLIDSFDQWQPAAGMSALAVAPVDRGFAHSDAIVITEAELFGRRTPEQRSRGVRAIDPDQIIKNLTELAAGAPVVHLEHGIGRYRGLMTLEIDGEEHEFLELEYAEEARLYVPVSALHLISRYAGMDDDAAPLHRLGSDQWEKAKRKAREKIHDVAAELLDTYARRELQRSAVLKPDPVDYARFSEQFPFELTDDQAEAIDAALGDLANPVATDRLICGDVGFGKTEVAMRAAFAAVSSGKQVAVLVPTTLLAQQHGDTFADRFASWGVHIEVISRVRSNADVESVKERLAAGKVDIVIGTHMLLSRDVKFADLGLAIIDEEHRFGVRQKESLKALRAEIDVLTLTATPIPRTLSMSMSGVRELSIIATPPAKRLAIKTFIHSRQRSVIREAISREIMRGGQVFYVYNEVKTIETARLELAELFPDASIGVGHGQMPTHQLEAVMNDFYHRRTHILLCTTIIETGIDIPNANTIIIERADKFGLAQLHQLRGRVGRSSRQAYAYLLTPDGGAMTRDAEKRLEAIEAAGELGVGFTLATHDLEIRGAGEILGDEQSGQIESIGFSLYMRMLDRAVEALRSGKSPELAEPLETSREVNLHRATLIPDDYLPDVHTRLIFYKRIASAESGDQLDDLQVEMIDRFGLLPPPAKRLFVTARLKLRATALGICKLDLGATGGKIEFSNPPNVDPGSIIALVQAQPKVFSFDGPNAIRVRAPLPEFDDRAALADSLLSELTTSENQSKPRPKTGIRRAQA